MNLRQISRELDTLYAKKLVIDKRIAALEVLEYSLEQEKMNRKLSVAGSQAGMSRRTQARRRQENL